MRPVLRFFPTLLALILPAAALAQPLVYVTDPTAGTVTAVNSGSNTIERQLTGFSGPKAVVVKADGTRIFVAESTGGQVAVLDGTKISGTGDPLIREIAVGGEPVALALSPDAQTLYVADAQNDQAEAVDLNTDEITKTYAAGSGVQSLALSPDGHLLAIGSGNKTVTLYALPWQGTGSAQKTLVNLTAVPKALDFDPQGRTLWMATGTGFASYSRSSGAVDQHTLSGGTTAVVYGVRQDLVYLGAGSGNLVYTYQPGGSGVGQIGTYGPVRGVALSADGTRLYAVQNCSNCGVAVINTAQGQALTQVSFGTNPVTAGRFAGPGAIQASDAVLDGQADEQASGDVSASDGQGRSLSYSVLAQPAQGSLTLDTAGSFVYTPPSAYSGLQSFVWQAAASSGDGSPIQPYSRPVTESLAIFPTVSSVADQKADPESTIGPLAFTIDGSVPLALTVSSTNHDVVNPSNVTLSAGCGTTSLNCTITIKVGSAGGSSAKVTVQALDPSGLADSSSFKVTTTGSSGSGTGALGLPGLFFIAACAALAVLRRRGDRPAKRRA